jgi:hypothetical protein
VGKDIANYEKKRELVLKGAKHGSSSKGRNNAGSNNDLRRIV